ncbi:MULTISPECIES: hypothetical protein [unclassified Geodermatophilus]
MSRWTCAVVVGVVLSGFTFLLLTGEYVSEGPILVRVVPDHGLHLGDVFVLAGWAVAMALLVVLVRTHRRPAGDGSPPRNAARDPSGVSPEVPPGPWR